MASRVGMLTVSCTHQHSQGEKVNLLARPIVTGAEAGTNTLTGIVTDVIFQQDRFKVTLDNGLYVYVPEGPQTGQTINVAVKVECLA